LRARTLSFFRTSPHFTRDEQDFLPAGLEILERPPSPIGRAIGIAIMVAVALALIWSIFGRIDIIATAKGRIAPVGETKVIQPMQAGTVHAILVADGDHVRAGQVLIELDPTDSGADRERYGQSLHLEQLKISRLLGVVAAASGKREPSLVDVPANTSKDELLEAQSAMRASWDEYKAKLSGVESDAAEKAAEEAEASASIATLAATLPIVREQASILEQAQKSQFGSRLQYLAAAEKLAEDEHKTAELASHRDQAMAARTALLRQHDEIVSGFVRDTLEEVRKTREDAIALQAEFTKAESQLSRQTLTSPNSGTVQQLAIHTIGGVVTPAQSLMVVVPDNVGLMVQANVENRDVGFIHKGQYAALKIEPFSFTRYGLIGGTVLALSHDTVRDSSSQNPPGSKPEDPDAAPPQSSYVANIALSRDWIQTENGRVKLGPGMEVTAEIQTGRRRIIDYLLSPLVRRVSESMHER
jgi:hemolysin D